jgi:hypothetical protein
MAMRVPCRPNLTGGFSQSIFFLDDTGDIRGLSHPTLNASHSDVTRHEKPGILHFNGELHAGIQHGRGHKQSHAYRGTADALGSQKELVIDFTLREFIGECSYSWLHIPDKFLAFGSQGLDLRQNGALFHWASFAVT